MHISLESGILVAEQFLQDLFKKYEKYPSPLMVGMVPATMWIFEIRHHTHSYYYEKSIIIERIIQYIKSRTEMFDDYFPCQKDNCTLEHVRNWFNLFVEVYNSMIIFTK
jgi:putative transposase